MHSFNAHSWTLIETSSAWQCTGSEDGDGESKLNKTESDQNAYDSARYKADGGQHGEEGEINPNWRVEWRTCIKDPTRGT